MMNNPQYPFGHPSNDLLFSLEGENSQRTLNYEIVAQSVEEGSFALATIPRSDWAIGVSLKVTV